MTAIVASTQSFVIPMEVFNHILLFRETHPVAKLIKNLHQKCNLCVNCMEIPRLVTTQYKDLECCSTACDMQMRGAWHWFQYHDFEGHQFSRFMRDNMKNTYGDDF